VVSDTHLAGTVGDPGVCGVCTGAEMKEER